MARELLAIGVDNYEDPRYARLREAPADAWKFWKFFTQELPPDSRFPVASAKLMLNPSAAEVDECLNDALKRLDNDSVFVFYFAGHATSQNDWSLLCRDAKDSNVNEKTELEWRLKAHIAAGSLSTAFLKDFSERVRGNAFFCFDICRSAAVLGTRDFGATSPFLSSTTAQASPFYSGEGLRWSLGSCGRGEHSKDDGAFVDALLAEMRATIESGRELRLDDNLATGVTRRLGGRQRPSACGSSFVLAPSAFEEFSDGSVFPLIRKRTDDLAQRLVQANVGEGLELSELRREYAALGKRLTEIRAQRVANPPSAVVDVWDAKTILDRFVLIPAGTFQMGNALSSDEIFRRWGGNKAMHATAPRHAVTLTRDYYVCRYPVRRGDFAKFVEATGYRTTAEITGNARGFGRDGQWSDVVGLSWRNPGFSQTDDHPVVCVSWCDAIEYIEWLNAEHQDVLPAGFQYALPTEAEWEYACRAGSTTEFFWGTNDPQDGQGYLNAADETGAPNGKPWKYFFPFRSGYKATSPVFSFKPNKWGLYDMLGNVWEWCADGYAPYPKSPVVDPIGNLTGSSRIIRGGSWCYGPEACRSAARSWCDRSSRMSRLGFRLVLKSRAERPAPPRPQGATSNSASGAGKGSAPVERRNHSNAVTSDARKAGASLSWTYHGVKSVFRYCPAGTFLMGSPKWELIRSADETQHKVTLTKGYWILETPVTQELWKAVTGERRSVYKGDQYPVEDVTWDACADFVSKLNQSVAAPKGFIFALPTEAQWEYACRAGTTTPYNVGDSIEKNNANFLISGIKETTPVRSYAPNAWGVYDMHGNVREWCADWYEYFQPIPKTDPLGPSSGGIRVIRGGGWASSAIGIRSAFRDALLPSSSSSSLGFRIVLRPLMKGERAPAVVDVAPTSQAKATKDAPASRPNGSQPGESLELTLYGVKSVFRHIQAGSFTMGSPATESGRHDDETRHSVTLTHDFWLLETPVTQALWRAGAGYYPCVFRGDAFPVEKVSWEDCAEFITKLNKIGAAPKGWIFDLPSEAEWEYACRAGATTPYDSGYNLTDKDANFNRNVGQTTPVKRYQPNAWGLYDMRGLVWELCADWYGDYATTPATDPIGAENALDRVLRGGSWRDPASACRAAFRACLSPNARHEGVGFRLALRSADLPQRAIPTPKPEPIQAPAPEPAKSEPLNFDFLVDTFPVESSDKETTIESATDLDFLTIDLADSSDEKTLPKSLSDDDFLTVALADSSVEEKLPDAYSVSEIDYAIDSDISQPTEIDVLTSDLTPNPTDVKAESAEASTPPEDASPQARQAGDPLELTLNGVKSVFRYCPAGTFLMGSPKSEDGRNNNETQHEVTLTKEFWILETPVTQGLWEAIIGEKPSVDKGEKYPVEGVNWHACVDFVSKLNQSGLAPEGFKFALPTEAQWEYTCRAGTTTRYNIGDKIRRKDANFEESGINESTPVRRYEPNAWGIYDMHGNIGEWCSDWYGEFQSSHETDPLGPSSGWLRVVRGGDWGSAAIGCRSAYRNRLAPSSASPSLGFRIVLRPLAEGELVTGVADVAPVSQEEGKPASPAPAEVSEVSTALPEVFEWEAEASNPLSNSIWASQGDEPNANQTSSVAVVPPTSPTAGDFLLLKIQGEYAVFRYCPAGVFTMGGAKSQSPKFQDETQHEVSLTNGFWILETPVTQELWSAVSNRNPSYHKGFMLPVETVSWTSCVNFIKKLNDLGIVSESFKFDLPTEAEWEYACRAGTTTRYNFGNKISKGNLNYGQYVAQSTRVKSYAPNAWGVYDMHGNVGEWCLDWYGAYPTEFTENPTGPETGQKRVVRGGNLSAAARKCSSSFRDAYAPTTRSSKVGFRIVLRSCEETQGRENVVQKSAKKETKKAPKITEKPKNAKKKSSAAKSIGAPAEPSTASSKASDVTNTRNNTSKTSKSNRKSTQQKSPSRKTSPKKTSPKKTTNDDVWSPIQSRSSFLDNPSWKAFLGDSGQSDKNDSQSSFNSRLSSPDKPDRITLQEESDASNLKFEDDESFIDSALNDAVDDLNDAFDGYDDEDDNLDEYDDEDDDFDEHDDEDDDLDEDDDEDDDDDDDEDLDDYDDDDEWFNDDDDEDDDDEDDDEWPDDDEWFDDDDEDDDDNDDDDFDNYGYSSHANGLFNRRTQPGFYPFSSVPAPTNNPKPVNNPKPANPQKPANNTNNPKKTNNVKKNKTFSSNKRLSKPDDDSPHSR